MCFIIITWNAINDARSWCKATAYARQKKKLEKLSNDKQDCLFILSMPDCKAMRASVVRFATLATMQSSPLVSPIIVESLSSFWNLIFFLKKNRRTLPLEGDVVVVVVNDVVVVDDTDEFDADLGVRPIWEPPDDDDVAFELNSACDAHN